MSWDYPIRFLSNFTATCGNGSYVFQALSSDGMAIGFPFSIQVDPPTNPSELYAISIQRRVHVHILIPGVGADAVVIGAAVGGSLAGLLAVIILIVLGALLYFNCMKTGNLFECSYMYIPYNIYSTSDNPVRKDVEKDELT